MSDRIFGLTERDRGSCREIVRNVAAATDCALVTLNLYDRAAGEGASIAWTGRDTRLLELAYAAVQRLIPGFDERSLPAPVETNLIYDAVLSRGESRHATWAEAMAHLVPPVVIWIGERMLGMRHAYLCPLTVRGAVIGMLQLFDSKPIDATRARVADTFARMATLALDGEPAAKPVAGRHDPGDQRLHLLLDLSSAIAATNDLDAVLDHVLERAIEVIPSADVGAVFFHDPETDALVPKACFGVHREPFFEMRLARGEGIAGKVYESGEPTVLEGRAAIESAKQTVSEDKRAILNRMFSGRMQSSITVPLRANEASGRGVAPTVIGTLAIGSTHGTFAPGDLPLVQGIASMVAVAVQRARAYHDAQLRAEQLREALDSLEAAQQQIVQQERLRALGQMAAGIAHDLNNALSPVAGFSELLLASPTISHDEERLTRYLQLIQTGALDAASVVARLREFYRPRESGDRFEEVAVGTLLSDVAALTRPRWHDEAMVVGKRIDVQLAVEDDVRVYGGGSQLREALTNLVFNAVDALPRGGVITLGARTTDRDEVEISVSDTGEGMPEDVRQRCLEPFFSTKGPAGTGLGLAMVHGIVERHVGRLEIESAPGRGTTIRLLLPAADVARAGAPASLEAHSAPAVQDRAAPRRVLLIDDEPSVRAVTAALLAADGHSVREAASGEEALPLLAGEPFDAVITDRAMPGMNGDQVAAAVKRAHPRLPVVLLSGYGALMTASGEKPAAVDAVLGKPASLRALRETLTTLCA